MRVRHAKQQLYVLRCVRLSDGYPRSQAQWGHNGDPQPPFSRSSQLELIWETTARHTHRLHGWGKPKDA